jgi:uncharacterized membrane protein YgdD (TMEM256/DUF423 family)
MTPRMNAIAATGATLSCLGVGMGAFGAHGLESLLEGAPEAVKRMGWWTTAGEYHLLHGVALVAVGAVAGRRAGFLAPACCLVLGTVVFSGTLYAMALGAPTILGAVTPLGGLALMVGWAWLGLRFMRRSDV